MNLSSYSKVVLFGAGMMLVAGCDHEIFQAAHGEVENGNEAFAEQRFDEAIVCYEEAASQIPESPELDFDRGVALSEARRHDDATQMLLRALETRDPELRGKVYAALGAAYAHWALALERSTVSAQAPSPSDPDAAPAPPADPITTALPKWERAVDHLEKAIRIMPGDEAVLRNLEVALLRVDPPCANRNDEHEPNNSPQQASLIGLAHPEATPQSTATGAPAAAPPDAEDVKTWTRQLLLCPEDTDWFQLDLQGGDRLKAKLTVPEDMGQLHLSLYAPGGEQRLRPLPTHDGPNQEVELTVRSRQAGPHLLQVTNVDGDEVSYGLDVEVRPACRASEDTFEENDYPELAAMLSPGPAPGLKICPLDADWYAVALAEGESLFVYASVAQGSEQSDEDAGKGDAPKAPPIHLQIRNSEGQLLSKGGPNEGARVASLMSPGEGRYLLAVTGDDDFEGRYDLLIHVVPPCPDGDDSLEDNDSNESAIDFIKALQEQAAAAAPPGSEPAAPTGPPQALLRICPGDEDWLGFGIPAEKKIVVSTVFEHAKGDLDLTLYDASGMTEIERADASSPGG